MEKDKIFFSNDGNGLTSTSANFCANLCKEFYSSAENALNSIVFYTTWLKLLSSSEKSLIKQGIDSVADVKEALKMVSECKSLVAWCREAISAKERLIKEANASSFEDYGMEVPERPVREDYITSDDVIAQMNIKQRNRYYYLEAFCATIGKYIHPDGVYASEREKLKKIVQEPHKVEGNGRDTLIYTRVPSLPLEEVEDTFMDLQQTYREYQAELNSIKHQIEETVNKDTAAKNIKYQEAMSKYRTQMDVLDAELSVRKKEAVDAACNLKIIIPDSLKPIYDKVQSLGKKK